MDEGYSDYKEINYNSEKDLVSDIDEILINLADVLKDWKLRDKSIKKIGGISCGNFGTSSTFIKLLNSKIIAVLSIQMFDLRTSIMREACKLVGFLASRYKNSFENAAAYALSGTCLFKIIANANKVITESASQCANQIAANVESLKLIPKVVEQARNKNANVKLRAISNIIDFLSYYNLSIIDKFTQLIDEFILITTHDSSSEVRAQARILYFSYCEKYPGKRNTLYSQFEHGIQRAINEEAPNFAEKVASGISNTSVNKFSNSLKEKKVENREISNSTTQNSIQTNANSITNSLNMKKMSSDESPKKKVNKFFSPQKIPTTSANEFEGVIVTKLNNNTSKNERKTTKNMTESLLISVLNEASSEDFDMKLNAFESLSMMTQEICNNIDNISSQTLKLLVKTLLEFLENNNEIAVVTMKIIKIFTEKIPELFITDDIEVIIKYVIIHLNSDSKEINSCASSLLIVMKKKFNNSIIIQPIVDFISVDDISDELILICLELILIFIDSAQEALSKDFYLNMVIEKIAFIAYEKNSNKDILSKVLDIIKSLYISYSKQFFDAYNSISQIDIKNNFYQFIELNEKTIFEFLKNSQIKLNEVHRSKKKDSTGSANGISVNVNSNSNSKSQKPSQTQTQSQNQTNSKQNPKVEFIKVFPENYENDLIKPVNREFLSRVNTCDSLSFYNYLSTNNKNILTFLISLFKIDEKEVHNTLEHIVYFLTVKPNIMVEHLDILLNRLILIYDNFPHYFDLISQAFLLITKNITGKIYLKLVPRYINKSSQPIIQILLNTLGNSFKTIESNTLKEYLPTFVDGIFNLMNHESSEIRKLAVFCIVDLYFLVGQEFEKYLENLSTSQKNLIAIYINKRSKK